jgi:hypothetical protein
MNYLAADSASDGEIDLSYVPTTEILADCFTKPLPKPSFQKQCTSMRMIVNGLGNVFGIGIRNGHGNGLGTFGNARGNGLGNENGHDIANAIGK